MTKAAKIVYFIALTVGLASGVAGGFWATMTGLREYDDLTRTTGPIMVEDFSYLQYRYADVAHAKEAAQLSVNLLKELEDLQPSKQQEADLAVSYGRLASLADQAGDSEQSQALFAEARRWNTSAGGRNLSDAEIKAGLKARDDLKAAAARALTQDNLH